MLATARARFAALMNAIRGRVHVAPALPKPPPMPPQIDMAAAMERLERMRADMEAMKALLAKR